MRGQVFASARDLAIPATEDLAASFDACEVVLEPTVHADRFIEILQQVHEGAAFFCVRVDFITFVVCDVALSKLQQPQELNSPVGSHRSLDLIWVDAVHLFLDERDGFFLHLLVDLHAGR